MSRFACLFVQYLFTVSAEVTTGGVLTRKHLYWRLLFNKVAD